MMTVPFPVFLTNFYGAFACRGDCGTETWWLGAVVVSCFYLVVGLAIGRGLTRGSDFAVTSGIAWAASVTVGVGFAIAAALLGFSPAQAVVGPWLDLSLHLLLLCAGVATLVLLIRVYRGEAAARAVARTSGARRREGLW
jgi:hypothetical protein